MKDENKNIDAFFSTRLQKENAENEDWNMPSDDIWNAAKPHFVNRKKKRKYYLWLLIPFVLVCAALPFVFDTHFNSNTETTPTAMGSNIQDIADGTDHFESKSTDQDERLAPNTTFDSDSKELTGSNLIEPNNADHTINPIKQQKNIGLNKAIVERSRFKNKAISTVKSDLGNELKELGQHSSWPLDKGVFIGNNNFMPTEVIEKDKAAKSENSATSESEFIEIASIDAITFSTESLTFSRKDQMSEENLQLDPFSPKVIKPIVDVPSNYEIGITHNQFLLNLFLLLDSESEEDLDKVKLTSNYFNAGISGSKWLNKWWSLSMGVQYSSLNLDIDFSVIDTLDKELLQFFNEEFNEIGSRSVIGNQDVDVVVDIKDGVDTQIGDVLNIQGFTTLKIQALQVPFFLNYHIHRRKMEYIFGMGASLEYIQVFENPSDLRIFKSNELISDSVVVPDFSDHYFDGSVFLTAGMRYKINNQINVGLNARVSLLDLFFSGIGAGVYYRFN